MSLLDFGAIARSGMAQVPDYAAQQAEQQLMALRESQQRLAQQTQLFEQSKIQRELDDEQAYQNDLADYFETQDPNILRRLQAKYPKKSEALQRAIDSQDAAVRNADRRQAADLHSFISNGRADLAARSLRERIAKSRQAGEPDDENDLEILAMLESGDPDEIKQAQGIITYHLALTSDDFSKSLKDLSGDEKLSPFMREYEDRVKRFGKESADAWAETKDTREGLLVSPGDGIYRVSDFVTKGGGQASSGGAAPPTSAAPTDIYSITETIESGGNVNAVSPKGAKGPMQTMPGTLRDPGFGVTPARDNSVPEMRRVGREYIDAMRAKYGGDMRKAWAAYNWGPGNLDEAIAKHGEGGWFAKAPAETRNYVRKAMSMLNKADKAITVKTKQQFEKLASGTVFIAPDGSRRVKP